MLLFKFLILLGDYHDGMTSSPLENVQLLPSIPSNSLINMEKNHLNIVTAKKNILSKVGPMMQWLDRKGDTIFESV